MSVSQIKIWESYVYWTVHHCDSWRIKNQLDFTSYVLNMFRTLIYPSSGACDYSVELPHFSYCSWFDVRWRFSVVGLEWHSCCRLQSLHSLANVLPLTCRNWGRSLDLSVELAGLWNASQTRSNPKTPTGPQFQCLRSQDSIINSFMLQLESKDSPAALIWRLAAVFFLFIFHCRYFHLYS